VDHSEYRLIVVRLIFSELVDDSRYETHLGRLWGVRLLGPRRRRDGPARTVAVRAGARCRGRLRWDRSWRPRTVM